MTRPALASLAAGNVAATEGLAQLIGETDLLDAVPRGRTDSLHISLISNKIILLLMFDEHSSLGLVRLRVKQHGNVAGRDRPGRDVARQRRRRPP